MEYYGFKNTKLKVDDSLESMVNKLRNDEIDAFIYSDLFPSFLLGKQLQKYKNQKINDFTNNASKYETIFINVSLLSKKYS